MDLGNKDEGRQTCYRCIVNLDTISKYTFKKWSENKVYYYATLKLDCIEICFVMPSPSSATLNFPTFINFAF